MPDINWYDKDSKCPDKLDDDEIGYIRPICPRTNHARRHSRNRCFKGDNLPILRTLEKEFYDVIYIDPPYNTRSKMSYNDARNNYTDPHSEWLNFMKIRLIEAHRILKDTGSIYISICDKELHYLRIIMDEVFGMGNYMATMVWKHKGRCMTSCTGIGTNHEYILVFAKNKKKAIVYKEPLNEQSKKNYRHDDGDGRGVYLKQSMIAPATDVDQKRTFAIVDPATGKEYYPPPGRNWYPAKSTVDRFIAENKIVFGEERAYMKFYLTENKGLTPNSFIEPGYYYEAMTKKMKEIFGGVCPFTYPKPIELLKKVFKISLPKDGRIIDFFGGSGSTGEAVMALNDEDGGTRKFDLIQIEETINSKTVLSFMEKNFNIKDATIYDLMILRLGKCAETFNKKQDTTFQTFMFEHIKPDPVEEGDKEIDDEKITGDDMEEEKPQE